MNRYIGLGPSISPEVDEDGHIILGTMSTGWDVSFGCRVNFGPNPAGQLQVSVHVSDRAQRDGVAVLPTTVEELRRLAYQLLVVAEEQEQLAAVAQ